MSHAATLNAGMLTLEDLAQGRQAPDGGHPAIEAQGRRPLSYLLLARLIASTVESLRAFGLGRRDRVAIVLPNGPEMATAFLSVACAAVCAPLNPAYRPDEFEFYLGDLGAKAIIVQAGSESSAREIAREKGVRVIELAAPAQQAAGLFELKGAASDAAPYEPARPDDVALVLHTSGTTSRPKIVPLTHRNLCVSARNVAASLSLTPPDKCLNIMPLFHVHGLVGALLSSLYAGATAACTPGFYAPRIIEWLEEFEPTWYTAVPTMHQTILGRVEGSRGVAGRARLRFIRSCSAAMPPQLMARTEEAFGAPLVEAYGMTEAAHQIACNPLPPLARKPRCVGIATGPEVAVMDDGGNLLANGMTGEIVIRGPNVTPGYENNPEANKAAFTDGWFRTGDQGYLDGENYLFLAGRIKEIINRAGEKISPREVDEVLLDHPAVAQAVTFAMPDAWLGEDVAAAVVLREGAEASEAEIRRHAAARLADFKVPSRVVFVKEIPKGPTGKLQRIGLAEKLGLSGAAAQGLSQKAAFVAPRTTTEEKIAAIWAEELGLTRVGVKDEFLALGGYSLLAVRIFGRILEVFGKRLPLTVLIEAPTVETLAALVERTPSDSYPPIVAIEKGGRRTPFFCIANADAFVFITLSRLLGKDQPFYGLHPQGVIAPEAPVADIKALASEYLKYIRQVQPKGPYVLGGKCSSGFVAFEAAQQLRREGEAVALLVFIDTPGPWKSGDRLLRFGRVIRRFFDHAHHHAANLSSLSAGKRTAYLREGLERLRAKFLPGRVARAAATPSSQAIWQAIKAARVRYRPEPYDGGIVMFNTPEAMRRQGSGSARRWRRYARGVCRAYDVNAVHSQMLHEPHVRVIAEKLSEHLERIAQGAD